MLSNNEKIYTSLCVLFTCLIIVGNLTYQKIVMILTPLHLFEISVGALLYPLTFLVTDLITEFYGKNRATFCIRFGMVMNIIVALIIALMDYLPATSWSKIDDHTFHQVFGGFGIAFVGSIIACYTAQAVDIILYLWIKKLTKGKYLWLRSNGSTCVSLLIDTAIIITVLSTFGIISTEKMWPLIINSYVWKLLFTVLSTPIFYLGVIMIKHFSNLNNQIAKEV